MQHNIPALTRYETLDALRIHVNPKYYQALPNASTPLLKALLFFFENGGTHEELNQICL